MTIVVSEKKDFSIVKVQNLYFWTVETPGNKTDGVSL